MSNRRWIPKEKESRHIWIAANKPIVYSIIAIAGVLVLFGLLENWFITITILIFIVCPIIFGVIIAKEIYRSYKRSRKLHR